MSLTLTPAGKTFMETAATIELLRIEGKKLALGYSTPEERTAFEHGVGTVCNMLLIRAGIIALPVSMEELPT